MTSTNALNIFHNLYLNKWNCKQVSHFFCKILRCKFKCKQTEGVKFEGSTSDGKLYTLVKTSPSLMGNAKGVKNAANSSGYRSNGQSLSLFVVYLLYFSLYIQVVICTFCIRTISIVQCSYMYKLYSLHRTFFYQNFLFISLKLNYIL